MGGFHKTPIQPALAQFSSDYVASQAHLAGRLASSRHLCIKRWRLHGEWELSHAFVIFKFHETYHIFSLAI